MIEYKPNPTRFDLRKIKEQLIQEHAPHKHSFYNNWNLVEDSLKNKNLLITLVNNEIAGFLSYQELGEKISINIVEIFPSFRNKGLGRKFIHFALTLFKEKENKVCSIFCSPENSEGFWSKIGFQLFPTSLNSNRINMYIPLVSTLISSRNNASNEVIELWEGEPYEVKNLEPEWIWNVDLLTDSRNLSEPIIFPVDWNWQIRYSTDGKENYIGKIKRSPFKDDFAGDFLFIQQLPNS